MLRDVRKTYVLTVKGPVDKEPPADSELAAIFSEAEENVTDLLPEGWSIAIDEWDAPVLRLPDPGTPLPDDARYRELVDEYREAMERAEMTREEGHG